MPRERLHRPRVRLRRRCSSVQERETTQALSFQQAEVPIHCSSLAYTRDFYPSKFHCHKRTCNRVLVLESYLHAHSCCPGTCKEARTKGGHTLWISAPIVVQKRGQGTIFA